MLNGLKSGLVMGLVGLFAAAPTSTNYTLKAFDFGNGGGSSSSTSYNLNGTTGIQSGLAQNSTTYGLKPGETPTQDANVPPAGTLTNPSSYYNKLKLVLSTGNNPTDTKFGIAISSDNFVTTSYVQNDNSVGPVLGIADYQTYATWGGASGFLIQGLVAGTTYKVRVSALQGNFSGSTFGPESSAVATVQPSISFGVATSLTATPPYTVSFASLSSGSVFSANATAELSLTTNAVFGGSVYVKGANNGLLTTAESYTIPSATADLSAAASGYGGQVSAVGQASGGPFVSAAPYNSGSNLVGLLDTSLRSIANTAAPITTGTVSFTLKAKAATTTPAAIDYSDRLTFIAAMLF